MKYYYVKYINYAIYTPYSYGEQLEELRFLVDIEEFKIELNKNKHYLENIYKTFAKLKI